MCKSTCQLAFILSTLRCLSVFIPMFSFRFSWFFLVLRWGNGIGDLGPSWTIHHRNPKRCHQDCNATDFEIDTCGSPHWNPTWLKNIVNKKHPYMQDSAPKSCPCLSEVWHGVPLWDDRHCIFLSTTGLAAGVFVGRVDQKLWSS